MEHECTIGLYFDYYDDVLYTLSDLEEEVKKNNYYYNKNKGTIYETKRPYQLEDYFNRRKNTNIDHFDYCPFCGKKIDWKKFREDLKNGKEI